MKVGFTGTKIGITLQQAKSLHGLLIPMKPEEAHHGDCVGADATFHEFAEIAGAKIVIHPPKNPQYRAFKKGNEMWEEKDYLTRNHDIVDCADIMIATPKAAEELRSGTWATVRYAKRCNKMLYIVWPNGAIDVFNDTARDTWNYRLLEV
jgi:hypothetical protein